MVNLKFSVIFKGTIVFSYDLTFFFLPYYSLLKERTLSFIKASTNFVSQTSTSDDFDSTLEVIHKESKDDDGDLVMLESLPVANMKNIIE
jgi:hypothetical protein